MLDKTERPRREVANEEELVFAQPAARRWSLLLQACRRCPIFLQRLAANDELMPDGPADAADGEEEDGGGQDDVPIAGFGDPAKWWQS